MSDTNSSEKQGKNDFNKEENKSIIASEFMQKNELDGYDTIDFGLLDDGYSENIEENRYNIEQQSIENNVKELIFETTLPFEKMKKNDLFLHDEIVDALKGTVHYNIIQEAANGFYDINTGHNGLVKLWNLQQDRNKNVIFKSNKPLVDAMLGTFNNEISIINAHYFNRFIPILNEERKTFIDVTEDEKSIKTGDVTVFIPPVIGETDNPITKVENYGTLRQELKNEEEPFDSIKNDFGISVTFSDNRIFNNHMFDTDVYLEHSYNGYYSSSINKIPNGIQRIIIDSNNNSLTKDKIIEPKSRKVIGFIEKIGNLKKIEKTYKLNIDDTKLKINRKHNGINLYDFNNIISVEDYSKLLNNIVPSMSELLDINKNIKTIEKYNKKIKKYEYNLSNMDIKVFENLKNILNNFEKEKTNNIKKIKYNKLTESLIIDKNGILFVQPNTPKIEREINSLKNLMQQKKYTLYSKYFINQKESIRNKIMRSTSDEVEQKELFKRYVTSHGTISKMSHSVVDGQGNFICCIHSYDMLIKNIDFDILLSIYGIYYNGGYSCKYCGEHLHTEFDEGPAFDEDGNLIVMHGEIEIDNLDETLFLDSSETVFFKTMQDAVVKYSNIYFKNIKINSNNFVKMFLKNMNLHIKNRPYLEKVLDFSSVEDILKEEAQKVKNPKISQNNVVKLYNTLYVMSMVCYKVAIFVSVFMLQLQLNEPSLFVNDTTKYVEKFTKIFHNSDFKNTVYDYIRQNSIIVINNKIDFLSKEIIPIGPFSDMNSMKITISTMAKKIVEENYKKLLISEKVDIIFAKHLHSQSKIVSSNEKLKYYGSVKVDHTQTNNKVENMYDIRVLASNYIKLIDTEDNNKEIVRSAIDISNKIGEDSRTEIKVTRIVPKPPYNNDLNNKLNALNESKNILHNHLSTLKTRYVKNIRNDVVPTSIEIVSNKSEKLKLKLIKKREIIEKEEKQEEKQEEKEKIDNYIQILTEFIKKNSIEQNDDLNIIKYWYPNKIFNEKLFKNLYSQKLFDLSIKKIEYLRKNIKYSDVIKIRSQNELYIKEMMQEEENYFNRSIEYFLQNYLRMYAKFYKNTSEIINNDDEEDVDNNKNLINFIVSPNFENYEILTKKEDESVLCLLLREMVYNITKLETISINYSLFLLKVSYEILLNINTKNSIRQDIDRMESEAQRKRFSKIKTAKDNNAELNLQAAASSEQENVSEEMEQEPQQIDKNDIAIGINENDDENDGNYASM